MSKFREFGCEASLLEAVKSVNDQRVPRFMDRITKKMIKIMIIFFTV